MCYLFLTILKTRGQKIHLKTPHFWDIRNLKFLKLWRHYAVIMMSSDTFLYHAVKNVSFISRLPFSLTPYFKRCLRYYALNGGHFCLKSVLSIYIVTLFNKNTLIFSKIQVVIPQTVLFQLTWNFDKFWQILQFFLLNFMNKKTVNFAPGNHDFRLNQWKHIVGSGNQA